MTITVRTLALVLGLILTGVSSGVYLLVRGGGDAAPAPSLSPGVPAVVTADQLAALSGAHSVHWAGELAGRRIELRQTGSGTFVRYLPSATAVGAPTRTLTIATYELERAWAIAQEAAASPDAKRSILSDGRVAVWRQSRPTSVYIAKPGSDVLVEVFDPKAAQARRLSLSGQVQPVSGA